jgi:hypothetical protein
MPEKDDSAGQADEVRSQFAGEGAGPSADDLPPVPVVDAKRPRSPGAPAPNAAPPRILGRAIPSGNDMQASGQAFTIGTNLVASIVVGAGAGLLVDKYLLHGPATPWGLIVGFLLGVTAGFINLIRVANKLNGG